MQIETLQNELQTNDEKLSALKTEKETLKSYEIIGMLVTQKSFGDGLAVRFDGAYITVEFDVGEKTFLLPLAFEKGFLTSEYLDFLESIYKKNEIDGEIEDVSSTIEEKKEQLTNLII